MAEDDAERQDRGAVLLRRPSRAAALRSRAAANAVSSARAKRASPSESPRGRAAGGRRGRTRPRASPRPPPRPTRAARRGPAACRRGRSVSVAASGVKASDSTAGSTLRRSRSPCRPATRNGESASSSSEGMRICPTRSSGPRPRDGPCRSRASRGLDVEPAPGARHAQRRRRPDARRPPGARSCARREPVVSAAQLDEPVELRAREAQRARLAGRRPCAGSCPGRARRGAASRPR